MQKYTLAIFSAPASTFRWARLYESANQKVLIDAQNQFFEEIGGTYETVVYDNMRNVVKRFIGKHDSKQGFYKAVSLLFFIRGRKTFNRYHGPIK